MVIIGYHTLEDRGNPNEILKEGPQLCYRTDTWFGHGYYFWDTEINWAHEWRRPPYMIFAANIIIDENTFDLLGNVQHCKDFEDWAKLLNDKLKKLNKPNANTPEIIQYMKQRASFPYNSIRGYDEPRPKKYFFRNRSNENFSLNKRVQICLIDKTNLLLQTFTIVHPEKYKMNK